MYYRLALVLTVLFVLVFAPGCAAPAASDEAPPSPLPSAAGQSIPSPTVPASSQPARTLPTLAPTVSTLTLDSTPAVPTPAASRPLPARVSLRAVTRTWTAEELLARKAKKGASVWAEGDELTFVYQGEADEVRVCCGIQLPLLRVQGSDLWVLTVQVRDLPRAVISYGFTAMRNGQPVGATAEFAVWRGAQAPPPVRRASSLRGQIKQYTLESRALGEQRQLTVYLPPNHTPARPTAAIYVADGQSVPDFAAVLEPLIVDGTIPSMLLVGVHSPAGSLSDPSQDLRAQEYLPHENPTRFAAHEQFFVEEVAAWAERELGAAADRQQRAVFGYSNSGVFAAAMGIRHPDRYGHILAFSLGLPPGRPAAAVEPATDFYLVAGTLEEGFHSNTSTFAQMLQSLGVAHVFRDRVCGHDYTMWQEEFPAAVSWAFKPR